ncbi:MAG: hypothetical protein R2751_15455 [Bacteroidales bacterium]
MIPGVHVAAKWTLFLSILITSCSGNVIQNTVFTDGFGDIEAGGPTGIGEFNPALYYREQGTHLGQWTVASTLRHDDFSGAWKPGTVNGEPFLAQTFSNLDERNSPFDLVYHPLVVAGDSLWRDYTVEAEFVPLAKFDKCGIVFRYQGPTDFYFFGIEGNTATLKQVSQPVTPRRPIEKILAYQPLVWTPGETFHALISVRRDRITAILNDSILMTAEKQGMVPGRIGLLSDMPARFVQVEVKSLSGEQRRLARRKGRSNEGEKSFAGTIPTWCSGGPSKQRILEPTRMCGWGT